MEELARALLRRCGGRWLVGDSHRCDFASGDLLIEVRVDVRKPEPEPTPDVQRWLEEALRVLRLAPDRLRCERDVYTHTFDRRRCGRGVAAAVVFSGALTSSRLVYLFVCPKHRGTTGDRVLGLVHLPANVVQEIRSGKSHE